MSRACDLVDADGLLDDISDVTMRRERNKHILSGPPEHDTIIFTGLSPLDETDCMEDAISDGILSVEDAAVNWRAEARLIIGEGNRKPRIAEISIVIRRRRDACIKHALLT